MISRELKASYYVLMRLPMRLSAQVYRRFLAPREGRLRVHLGPGQANYLPGWINVDANIVTAKLDVWSDLRDPLPFNDSTVDAFYSHHVIEHLPDTQLPTHFRDVQRCLKPGGIIRVGVPHADVAIAKFLEGDTQWFSDFPDKRTSVGGRFANFILCRGEHLSILTESYLRELLEGSGFANIRLCMPRETHHPQLIDAALLGKEEQPTATPHTLIVEAEKPSEAG